MIEIIRSKIFKLEEIEILSPPLSSYLSNRIFVNSIGDDSPDFLHKLEDKILQWIEESIESKVIVEKKDIAGRFTGHFEYVMYFETDTDLTMFVMRWQGKND